MHMRGIIAGIRERGSKEIFAKVFGIFVSKEILRKADADVSNYISNLKKSNICL